jgi:hypothetical protein
VEAARAKVAGKKKAVDVDLQVMVDPEADLAATASEVSRVVHEAVVQQMSVDMAGAPRLRLYYSARSTSGPPASRRASAAEPQEGKRTRKARIVPGAGEGEPVATTGPTPPMEGTPPESKENEGQ